MPPNALDFERLVIGTFLIDKKGLDHSIDLLTPEVFYDPRHQVIFSTILKLYNENAIVVEPAGAMSIAALDDYADVIKNKTVVCIVSGGNNDIDRMPEIKERSLQYEGLKHYFLVRFAQRPGL